MPASGGKTVQLRDEGRCFACGGKNPIGLKMQFTAQGEEYLCDFLVGENYQGFDGIAHGGIIATALDEIMARLLTALGYNALTAKLEVRYLKPIPVGECLSLRAKLLRHKGRLLETTACACLADGTIAAEAKAASLCV
jgi:acyl-coenzyme A thioesterase PaaI-like protein